MVESRIDSVQSRPTTTTTTSHSQDSIALRSHSNLTQPHIQRNQALESDANHIKSSMNSHQHGQPVGQQKPLHLQAQQQHYPSQSHLPNGYAGDHFNGMSSGQGMVQTNARIPMSVVGGGNSIAARREMVTTSADGIKARPQHSSIPINAQQLYSSYIQSHPPPQPPSHQNQRQSSMIRSSSHQGISIATHPPPFNQTTSIPMNRTQSAYSASNLSPYLDNQGSFSGPGSAPMERGHSNSSSVTLNDFDSPQLNNPCKNSKTKSSARASKSGGKQAKNSRRASAASGSRGGSVVSDGDYEPSAKRFNRPKSRSRSKSVDSAPGSDSVAPSPDLGTIADIDAIDNRLGPCPTSFPCPYCEKVYTGTHARSVWRRHLAAKHKIALSDQPRRSRWDAKVDRPRSKNEKRDRALASKRKWAKRDRMMKKYGKEEGAKRWEQEEKRMAEEANGGGQQDQDGDDQDDESNHRANALGLGLFEDSNQPTYGFEQNSYSQMQPPEQAPSNNDARWWTKSKRQAASNSSFNVPGHPQAPQFDNNHQFMPNSSLPASAPGGKTLTLSSPRTATSELSRSAPTSPVQGVSNLSMAARSATWLSGVAFASSPDSRRAEKANVNEFNNHSTTFNHNVHNPAHYGLYESSSSTGVPNLSVTSADMQRSRSDCGPSGDNGSDFFPQFYHGRGSETNANQMVSSSSHQNFSRESLELSRSNSLPVPTFSSQPLVVGAPGSSSHLIIPNKTPVTHYSDLYPTPPSMGNASSSGEPSRTVARPATSPTGGFDEDQHNSDLHKKRTGFGMSLGGQLRNLPWPSSQGSQQTSSFNAQPSRPSTAPLVAESPRRQPQQQMFISPNRDKSDKMLSLSQLPPRSSSSIPISKSQSHLGISSGLETSSSTGSLDFNMFFNSGSAHSDSPPEASSAQSSTSMGAPSTHQVSQPNQLSSAFVPSAASQSQYPPRDITNQTLDANSKMEMERPSPSNSNQAASSRRFNLDDSPLARRLKSSESGPGTGLVRFSPSSHLSGSSLSSRPNSSWYPSSSTPLSFATSTPSTLIGSTPKRKGNPFSLDQHRISPLNTEERKRISEADKARTLPPMLGLTPLRSVSAPSKRRREEDQDDGKDSAGASPLARRSSGSNHQHESNGISKMQSIQSAREEEENSPEELDGKSGIGKTPSRHHQLLFSSPANMSLANSLGLAPMSDFRFASTPGRRAFDDSFGSLGYTPSTLTRLGRMEGGSSNFLLGMGFTPLGSEKRVSPSSIKGKNRDGLESSFSQFITSESPFTNSLLSKSSKDLTTSFDSPSSLKRPKVSNSRKESDSSGPSKLKKLEYGKPNGKSRGEDGGEELEAEVDLSGTPSKTSNKKLTMVR